MSNVQKTLEKQIISFGEKHNVELLQKLIEKTNTKSLTSLLTAKLGFSDCAVIWNYLLQGFDPNNYDAREKRFACVKCFLDGLLKIELTYKQTYDLITRLCKDLPTFPSVQLIEVLEHCMDALRAGDPKCVGWKDLLPETLQILATQSQLNVNGVSMSGTEYRNTTVRNLCTMRWPTEVITPIADMFKNMQLNANEMNIILNKFSASLQSLAPSELPALCYQLFSLCTTASQIMVPILSLEKYFHRYHYKKLFADMNSNTTDFDSIDAYSDKELREAEETIFHHLNYCTQYKISEIQLCIVLRNFFSMPDVMLTPFMLSAILCMSTANREPDSRLSTSYVLPFLRTIIKHNEDERALSDYSVWCRDSLHRKQVDIEQVFTVLIDQNKEGKDVITPGLVNLAFVMLKAKDNKSIHALAIAFLTKFIRKRFIFGQGVVKKVAEWMLVEQEQSQYSECLTLLSVADTFTVSECFKTINYVMDFFLWLPGEQSMRMMSFILPTLKLSPKIRDAFIAVLCKAITASDLSTRRMAVYGFCMILKQLNNSNSARSQVGAASICTQQMISGFSLMSQATLGNPNNPQRHFDMLTLEIIGLLRNCFQQPLEIKRTLYENLQRAVELNPKLVPHVLQFIDWHFRSNFHVPPLEDQNDEENSFAVKFTRIVHARDESECEIEVNDNLGYLILFVSQCLVIFEKFEQEYDTREMKHILNMSVEKVIGKELKFEEAKGKLTHLKNELFAQQLNFIEGLMAYCTLAAQQTNELVRQLTPLYREHRRLQEAWKSLASTVKKAQKKSKGSNDSTDITSSNVTINGVVVKKIEMQVDCIWDFDVLERVLRLLHEDVVPFAVPQHASPLRSNVEFVRFVFTVAARKIEGIRLEPEYKQLSHSRRTLTNLTNITRVIYERCIKRLPELWRDFDAKSAALAAECFRECLLTANQVYKKKFVDVFTKGFDFQTSHNGPTAPNVLHGIISDFMQEDVGADVTQKNSLSKDANARNIPCALFQCLEVLYDNVSFGNRITCESYSWLLEFCKQYEVNNKDMGLVHKLLFVQRQKTHSGAFFHTIAWHLGKVLGYVKDELVDSDENMPFALKSITMNCVESCLQYLYAALRKQIEDVDYFIAKANNLHYKYRIVSDDDRELCLSSLRALERSICSQLVHISNALLQLTNVCIPLGSCMDNLIRLLMLHYTCLKNLTKHFLSSCGSVKLPIQSIKFDGLLHVVGKPLPTNIYSLITYIEANILEDNRKRKVNPQVEKAKVLRETKLIPKIILCVENFNTNVILLSKKTSDRLPNFLHFGTVRDFRIKTADLKAAISKTLSHSSQIEADHSDDGDDRTAEQDEETLLKRMEAEGEGAIATDSDDDGSATAATVDKDVENDENASGSLASSVQVKKRSVRGKRTKVIRDEDSDAETENETLPTPDDEVVLEHESNKDTHTQVLKNLAKINKKAQKRTLRDSEQGEAEVVNAAPPTKKTRGRSSRK